ncbi:MAG: hypothetical protein WCW17_02855 [Patescibacteria group bacterium]|jgi:cell division septal protein FtsQ
MKKNKYSYSTIYYPTPKAKDGGFYISPKSIKWFVLLLVVGCLVYFFYFSSFFNLNNIIFEGEKNDQLIAEASKLKGRNLLFISSDYEEKELLKKMPNFKSLTFYKGLPDSVKITGELRKKSLVWLSEGKYYSVDDKGMLYEEINNFTNDGTFLIIEDKKNVPAQIGRRIISNDFIDFVKTIRDNFSLVTGQKITGMSIEESTYHIYVSTDANWKAIFTLDRSASDQLEDLKLILTKARDSVKEYVDLRIEGRAYYK